MKKTKRELNGNDYTKFPDASNSAMRKRKITRLIILSIIGIILLVSAVSGIYYFNVDNVETLFPANYSFPHYTAEKLIPDQWRPFTIMDDRKIIVTRG